MFATFDSFLTFYIYFGLMRVYIDASLLSLYKNEL